jgi:hypothetical protein
MQRINLLLSNVDIAPASVAAGNRTDHTAGVMGPTG